MSNHLTLFDQAKPLAPTHIADMFGDDTNIEDRLSVPSLSYEGKVWTIGLNGEKTKLMKRNSEGDEEPVSVMRVVVLDYGKRRGRAYYEGTYDPANPGKPVCWSDDGVTPDDTVPEPQCATCEGCPMSVKGSKVTEQGKAVQACSQHRMLAVVPANKLDFEPLRLKIAITSDYDKQSPELEAQGWFAFSNYTDFLRSKGVKHTAALVTKMRFDPNVAYPKVIFSPDRWLEQPEAEQVLPLTKDERIKNLLGGRYTPAGVDGEVKEPPLADDEIDVAAVEAERKKKAAAAKAAETKAKNAAAKKAEEEAAAKAAEEKAAAAKRSPATQLVDDDDDGMAAFDKAKDVTEPKAAAKAKDEPKATAAAEVPDDVAALLADWEDD